MAKDIGENIMSTFNEDNVNKTITDNINSSLSNDDTEDNIKDYVTTGGASSYIPNNTQTLSNSDEGVESSISDQIDTSPYVTKVGTSNEKDYQTLTDSFSTNAGTSATVSSSTVSSNTNYNTEDSITDDLVSTDLSGNNEKTDELLDQSVDGTSLSDENSGSGFISDELTSNLTNTPTNKFSDTITDSLTLSSESEIFFDHGNATNEFNSLAEKIDLMIDYNAKLNSLLNDINDYWGGSSKDTFVKNVQTYIETINKYVNYIDNKHIGLKNADTAYSKLDETFSAKEI